MLGLVQNYFHWLHGRWPAGKVEKLPLSGPDGATNLPGVRLAGDLTGIPLLKFSADTGARAVHAFLREPDFTPDKRGRDGVYDLAIIGFGVAGLSAAIEAKKAGLKYVVFEATQKFSTIANFPKAKPIFTYPTEMTPAGELRFASGVKEALLDELEAQRAQHGIETVAARIEKIERRGGELVLVHGGGREGQPAPETRALKVVVAIGRSGNYRKLGAPGEDLDKVSNRLYDPMEYGGKHVLVVGGGDSALEAAIALTLGGAHVTLSYRKKEFARPKPDNIAQIEMLTKDPMAPGAAGVMEPVSERVTTAMTAEMRGDGPAGSLRLALGTSVAKVTPKDVTLKGEGGAETLPNDYVFVMIGREAPLDFFRRNGLRVAGEHAVPSLVGLGLFMLFCVFFYNFKAEGHFKNAFGPFPGNVPELLSGLGGWWQAQVADRTTLLGTLAVSMKGNGFYYTLAYSLCVVVFGIDRMRRKPTPYIRLQTSVLMFVQVVPLFLLPELILPWMGYNGAFNEGLGKTVADNLFELDVTPEAWAAQQWPDWGHPRAYWRAYGFILAWPLMVANVFTTAPMLWWLVIAFTQTFVLIPALIYFFGKGAYCGWMCSCGALAETLGDRHRHKMWHGPQANRWNMVGQVILGVAFLFLAVRVFGWVFPDAGVNDFMKVAVDGKTADGGVNYLSYKWIVDILIGGILGVGLYFHYSGRVWCRFACPLAALMHVYARFSKFRIFSEKKKCISCNVCTSVCHQGIDVMNFANKGLPMEDPECVRCSACVQSCPTGVLSFGRLGKNGEHLLDLLPASPVQMREAKPVSKFLAEVKAL